MVEIRFMGAGRSSRWTRLVGWSRWVCGVSGWVGWWLRGWVGGWLGGRMECGNSVHGCWSFAWVDYVGGVE